MSDIDIEVYKYSNPIMYEELVRQRINKVVLNDLEPLIEELSKDPSYEEALKDPQFMDVVRDVVELEWRPLLMYAKSVGVNSYGHNKDALRKEVIKCARERV